jgi:Flp pilus assembly protein TadG
MRRRGGNRSRGAAAVEFAIILPLLLSVLFGIIEFGSAYSQMLDVRHGAREGARLLSVNHFAAGFDATTKTGAEQSTDLVATICDRMDFADDATVSLELIDATQSAAGATAVVTVSAELATITGWFDPILAGKRIESSIEVRLEQEAQWLATTDASCPTPP